MTKNFDYIKSLSSPDKQFKPRTIFTAITCEDDVAIFRCINFLPPFI